MALFDPFNRGKIRQLESQIQQLANHAMYDWFLTQGVSNVMPDDPHQYLEKGYQGNTSVYSIINRIDMMRKQAVLRLVDKEGKELETHELTKFLTKVNANLSTDEFITQFLIYRLTIGEFFVYKPVLNAGLNVGKVYELTPLPSADVEIIEGDWLNPVRGYKIDGQYSIELTAENTYHSKLFNPNWFSEKTLHGMSPLRAAAKTVSKLNQIEITEQKGYENQGPPYILQKKNIEGGIQANTFTDTQREELEKQIKKKTGEKYRGLPFIGKIPLEKIDLGSNIVDMKTIESSNSGTIALCGIYCFPPELAGYGQKTYSNMGTARKAAWTDCIMPNFDAFVDMMNEILIYGVGQYAKQGIKFVADYSEVEELSEGMADKVNWMVQAGWSGNEIREATNQPPSENPLMNEPRVNMGVSFISDYGEPLSDDEDTDKSFEDYKK